MFTACPTFTIVSFSDKTVLEPVVHTVSVSDPSLCLADCMERNCTMFTYNITDAECKLYNIPFEENQIQNETYSTLYVRLCNNTGTYVSMFVLFLAFKLFVTNSFKRS